ncbi:MAG: class I SAM-dependent methyltransferase [Ilumatobacter sp.]|uniref:class I SAM-dependent methyltransferase n=1 Tax=Ilumatobacter sp. TaxID=1967498 RepID=UPI0032970592
MNHFHRWYCRTGHWRHAIQDQILPWVLRDVDLGDHVLEIGPGPGLTTDVLARRVAALTAVEIDAELAARLRGRFVDTNVTVQQGDATAMPFPDGTFTGAVSFTMLHHVPSPELQDQLLREVRRVLRPGGTFAGSDSRSSRVFRLAHLADTMVLVDPDTFASRLEAAGFRDLDVEAKPKAFRFRSTVPTTVNT